MTRKIIIILICLTLSFSSCSLSVGIDSALQPPKLDESQIAIHKAMTDSLTGTFRLKYPKEGDYLSAFIIKDIDGDGSSEALVFYEPTSVVAEDVSLRLNVLTQENGVWRSVYDYATEGTEVEKVVISSLGPKTETLRIAIGYTTINQSEKLLEIYTFSDNELKISRRETYSYFNVYDIDSDKQNELLIISSKTATSPALLRCLKYDSGKYYESNIPLGENEISPANVLFEYNGSETLLYLDMNIAAGTIQTEIYSFNNGQFMDLIAYTNEPNIDPIAEKARTIRPSGYLSSDINKDGIIEIPVIGAFPGYQKENTPLPLIEWTIFKYGTLTKTFTGYYSLQDKLAFVIPYEFYEKITVKPQTIKDEIVFYEYNESIEKTRNVLMYLSVATDKNVADKTRAGYKLLKEVGKSYYMVKLPSDKFTFETVKNYFIFDE